MKVHIHTATREIAENIINKKIFFLAIVLSLINIFTTTLHYLGFSIANFFLWGFWLSSVVLLFVSFLPKKKTKFFKKKEVILLCIITIVYWISHLWNFSSAPWNTFGLFDDAAWDIYFAKNHAFIPPFQAAFFDSIGYISREVVFHYYITIFFKLFGYNLLVFNMALIFLGYVTVLFTALLIYKIFHNLFVAILGFLIINFFPFHYMHIFMGHRYAIAAPLMMVSLFFLYTGFKNKSYLEVLLSSFFAFLCWDSSIMGKQYIAGLFICGFIYLFFRKNTIPQLGIGITWFISFLLVSIPLILYIVFNYRLYSAREAGLLKDFLSGNLGEYMILLKDLFFSSINYRRQFLFDNLLIPIAYYGFLLSGVCIAFVKKQYIFIILGIIPIIGAFFSGAYDFRVLLAVPIWIILISFSVDYAVNAIGKKNAYAKNFIGMFCVIVASFGLFPSIFYIWNVSKNPNYMHLLFHKDVAVSRLVQDIVAGEANPSIRMKDNEFNRILKKELTHDSFVSLHSSYALIHLFLKDFDDKKILSFNNQGVQLFQTSEEILKNNIETILSYKPQGKDVKLIWGSSEKIESIIPIFNRKELNVKKEIFIEEIEGTTFSLIVLTIPYNQIEKVQNYLRSINI